MPAHDPIDITRPDATQQLTSAEIHELLAEPPVAIPPALPRATTLRSLGPAPPPLFPPQWVRRSAPAATRPAVDPLLQLLSTGRGGHGIASSAEDSLIASPVADGPRPIRRGRRWARPLATCILLAGLASAAYAALALLRDGQRGAASAARTVERIAEPDRVEISFKGLVPPPPSEAPAPPVPSPRDDGSSSLQLIAAAAAAALDVQPAVSPRVAERRVRAPRRSLRRVARVKRAVVRGRKALRQRRYRSARRWATAALRVDRRHRRARRLKRQAEQGIRRAAQCKRRLGKARLALRRRQWSAARRWARAALRADPRSARARKVARIARVRLRGRGRQG